MGVHQLPISKVMHPGSSSRADDYVRILLTFLVPCIQDFHRKSMKELWNFKVALINQSQLFLYGHHNQLVNFKASSLDILHYESVYSQSQSVFIGNRTWLVLRSSFWLFWVDWIVLPLGNLSIWIKDTFEDKYKMKTSFETKRQLCNKIDSFSFLILFFTQIFKYESLIFHNTIPLRFHNKLLINNLHRIILAIEIAPNQEHSTESPRSQTFNNIKITNINIFHNIFLFLIFENRHWFINLWYIVMFILWITLALFLLLLFPCEKLFYSFWICWSKGKRFQFLEFWILNA